MVYIMKSIDPSIWGPPFWRTIHFVALGYPRRPTREDAAAYRAFFEGIGSVIPCKVCAVHYSTNIKRMPVANAIGSPESLFQWTVAMHNLVNTQQGKPVLSPDVARAMLLTETGEGRRMGAKAGCVSSGSVVPVIIFAFAMGAIITFAIQTVRQGRIKN
jgi:hypothetical protein